MEMSELHYHGFTGTAGFAVNICLFVQEWAGCAGIIHL